MKFEISRDGALKQLNNFINSENIENLRLEQSPALVFRGPLVPGTWAKCKIWKSHIKFVYRKYTN